MTELVIYMGKGFVYALLEAGKWVQESLSVEGLIALPALMASFLIALAIYNFEDSRKGLLIDASTIMTQVVKVPHIIWSFIFVSGIVILFEVNSSLAWLLSILMITYLLGLLLLVQSLWRSYLWARSLETGEAKNIRTIMRTLYLKNLKDAEKVAAWEKLWYADEESRNLIDQRELVRLFIESLYQITSKNDTATSMVRNFISAIDTISIDDPIIMEYLIKFCLSEGGRLVNESAKGADSQIAYTISVRDLFMAILDKALEKNNNSLYSLIHTSMEYLASHNIDEVYFIGVFATNLIDKIKDKEDKSWVWGDIPNEWKVTVKNLDDTKNKKAALAMLNAYSRMLNSMPLYTKPGELNMSLQTITAEILPNADPMLWAKLFSFHWSPYGVNKGESSEHAQVRNYIENHLSFGFMSHVHTQYGDYDNKTAREAVEREEQEVIDIAVKTTVFGFFHNDETMKRYLLAIRQLKNEYSYDKDKLNKLLYLESVLKKIQKQIRITKRAQPQNQKQSRK